MLEDKSPRPRRHVQGEARQIKLPARFRAVSSASFTEAAATESPFHFWASFVDGQGSPADFPAVEGLQRVTA
jgi:hypothetical protein